MESVIEALPTSSFFSERKLLLQCQASKECNWHGEQTQKRSFTDSKTGRPRFWEDFGAYVIAWSSSSIVIAPWPKLIPNTEEDVLSHFMRLCFCYADIAFPLNAMWRAWASIIQTDRAWHLRKNNGARSTQVSSSQSWRPSHSVPTVRIT